MKICEIVQICKYIHKYIYKNDNHIILHFKEFNQNEISKHLNECYIDFMQTAFQMLKYLRYKKNLLVTVLTIHLSNKQSVYYSENIFSQ